MSANHTRLAIRSSLAGGMCAIDHSVAHRVVRLLLANQHIDHDTLDTLSSLSNDDEYGFIHHLINEGICRDELIAKVMSEHYALSFVENISINEHAYQALEEAIKIRYKAMPFDFDDDGNTLKVAIADPACIIFQAVLNQASGLSVVFYLVSLGEFARLSLDKGLGAGSKQHTDEHRVDQLKQLESLRVKTTKRFNADQAVTQNELNDSPVVVFVDTLLTNALALGASDIHIEPDKTSAVIRFRIDGVLAVQYHYYAFINQHYQAVVARFKILAGCDISERRLPQDGGLAFNNDTEQVDVRISVLPCQYGERVVVRLMHSEQIFNLDALNLSEADKTQLIKSIEAPQGMVLVTGPTGSGKSTTLYAALRHIKRDAINIMTVENPVEHYLQGVAQVQTNEAIGLNFASVLRSFLRQDPEVILVGEIRDKETIDVAMKAAFTGHLVLSTLHTNNAIGTIIRLLNMGVPAFVISASLSLVIAQRLVRKNCQHCLTNDTLTADALVFLGFDEHDASTITLKKSTGCFHCHHSGFSGRVGVFECLKISQSIEQAILQHQSEAQLLSTALENGFKTMWHHARLLLKQGIVSVEECQRVLSEAD